MRYAVGPGEGIPRLSTPISIFDTQDRENLQQYVGAQIDALRVLLIRTGGQKMGDRLETIVNTTSEQNDWDARLESGQLKVGTLGVRSDVYRGLISKAVTYSVSVVGKKLVVRQMTAVDEQLGERALELAMELNLLQIVGNA
jgi:hypothetical protein